MNKFSAKREHLMSFEVTYVVCFNGVAIIERGCSATRARALVRKLNAALKRARLT